jgi:hypothetical protein
MTVLPGMHVAVEQVAVSLCEAGRPNTTTAASPPERA